MAWLNLTMPNQTVKNGLKAKKIKLPQMNFFLKKQLILFKKILRAHPELRDVPFSDPKWSICPEQIFLVQTIIITLICLLALFIVQNLKNSYSRFRVLRMHNSWAQNGPLAQMRTFSENLLTH